MSGVAVVLRVLERRAALTALVPIANQVGGQVPQGSKPPAIGVTEVTASDVQGLDGLATNVLVRSRVQITIVAKDFPQQQAVLKEVRRACRSFIGGVTGFSKVTCHLDTTGPDFQSAEGLYIKTQDCRVTFTEPA